MWQITVGYLFRRRPRSPRIIRLCRTVTSLLCERPFICSLLIASGGILPHDMCCCCRCLLLLLQSKKRWEAEMKERGLSKDEAFMVETAQSAEIVSQHKSKKEKHKAAFGEWN